MTLIAQMSAFASWTGGILSTGAAAWAESWLIAAAAAAVIALAVVGVLLQLKRPIAGLMLLLVTAVLVPMEIPLGGGVLNLCFPLAAFVCGSFMLSLFRRRGRIALDRSRVVTATLVFVAVAVMSFVIGQYPWFPIGHAPMAAQLGGLLLFLLSAGLFLVVGHGVTTTRQLQRLTWLFVATGAFAVVSSIVPVFEWTAGPVAITDAGSIGSAFWTWFVAVSLGQALFNRALPAPARTALAAAAALALARGLLVAFSWASGWLPPLVAAGVLLLYRFPRLTVAVGLLALPPAIAYAGPAVQVWIAGEAYSSATRIEALRIMWQIVQHNPWLGFGPANYYHYTQLFPILGWWVPFNSHNNYVDLVAQTGAIGLLAFGWLVAEVSRLALRLRVRMPRGFEQAYVLGAVAGLAGSLVSGLLADWIIPFTYNIGVRGFRSSLLFWFFLGGVLALKRIAPEAAPGPVVAVRAR